jgi:Helix-turn-helix domain
MSVRLMGAVFDCGPQDQTSAFVMLAIADNADDFGFACPSYDTIAQKARCDAKTVGRHIEKLEADDWLRVGRKLMNGKGNAYFINLAKLGVMLHPDANRSPLHTSLIKRSGDILSAIFARKPRNQQPPVENLRAPEKSEDTGGFSGDNPQPPQRTSRGDSEDIFDDSEDIRCPANHEPLLGEPSEESLAMLNLPPQPPTGGEQNAGVEISRITLPDAPSGFMGVASAEQWRRWNSFRMLLKEELALPPTAAAGRSFSEIRKGENDFDACFRCWWLFEIMPGGSNEIRFRTEALDPSCTDAGIAKYRQRIERAIRLLYPISKEERISFVVRATATSQLERTG